jgi:predicted GNAT family N-acyltransferase
MLLKKELKINMFEIKQMNEIEIKILTYKEADDIINQLKKQVLNNCKYTENQKALYLIAYKNKIPVGMIDLVDLDENVALISNLIVLPEANLEKVSIKLIKKALELATLNDFDRVLVETREIDRFFYEQFELIALDGSFERGGITYIKMSKYLTM